MGNQGTAGAPKKEELQPVSYVVVVVIVVIVRSKEVG
jgi:hypothetical protein